MIGVRSFGILTLLGVVGGGPVAMNHWHLLSGGDGTAIISAGLWIGANIVCGVLMYEGMESAK
jgi:hypothetical protein